MIKRSVSVWFVVVTVGLSMGVAGCRRAPEKAEPTHEDLVTRGAYLVNLGGCNDCHSPKVFTDKGMEFDQTRLLSGHPQGETLPKIDPAGKTPGQWVLASPDLTAWVGPWGVSFTANLTPDEETGIGAWTEEVFVNAMRRGQHMGGGRPILPPMPWQALSKVSDEDLAAIFAYLQSLPPIKNEVPDPIPPDQPAP